MQNVTLFGKFCKEKSKLKFIWCKKIELNTFRIEITYLHKTVKFSEKKINSFNNDCGVD